MSFSPMMLEWLKNLSSLISLHRFFAFVTVEKGFAIFFMANSWFVWVLRALHTMP